MKNLFIIGGIIMIAVFYVWEGSDPDRGTTTATQEPKEPRELSEEEKKIAAAEELIGPAPWFVRRTGIMGGSAPVMDYLKRVAKDPDSIEYIEWEGPALYTDDDGEPVAWQIYVRYRARNSFGGMVIEEGIAYIRHGQVVEFEQ